VIHWSYLQASLQATSFIQLSASNKGVSLNKSLTINRLAAGVVRHVLYSGRTVRSSVMLSSTS
jgi:hypothetical protein